MALAAVSFLTDVSSEMIYPLLPLFLSTTLGHDVLKRAVKPLEGHKGPPGYYLLTIWATFFPIAS